MRQDFSSFVRLLGQPEEPPAEAIRATLDSLRRILRTELDRRGLWQVAPGALGVFGWKSWGAGEAGAGDALDELTADCYTYIFVRRLQSLLAQLRVKPNIEGLVFRNVKNFLYDRQRRCDPIGFRVFEATQQAIRQGAEEQSIWIVSGNSKVGPATVFATTRAATRPASHDEVAHTTGDLADATLPDIVTARGRERATVVQRLLDALTDGSHEDRTYRFSDIVSSLKSEVRTRWTSLYADEAGETALSEPTSDKPEIVAVTLPPRDLEDRDWITRVSDHVLADIESSQHKEKKKVYLERLWFYACGVALEPGWDPTMAPSQRRLARELSIPRDRLSELGDELRAIVDTAREAELETRAVKPQGDRR